MANIPLTYKISWYNPAYPGGQIHTQNDNMNHTTSASTQYTMQDIIDTVAYDAGSVERDGTPIAGYISQWTSPDKIKGQTVSSSYKPAKLDNGMMITVPPFIENGDKIIIDTRNLEYVKKNN